MLKKIGLSPSKKLLVFLLSAILISIPLPYAYSSIAVVIFVLYSVLSARKEDAVLSFSLLLPLLLFGLMALSLLWTVDFKSTLKALGKEAALLFIPIAFCFNSQYIRLGYTTILKNYSIGMCLFGLFYVARAALNYIDTGNPEVFFYHELVTHEVNAIYISALFSTALFYFISKKIKLIWDYACMVFLLGLIFLLSSKLVLGINILLITIYFIFYSGLSGKKKGLAIVSLLIVMATVGYYSKIGERLKEEYFPNTEMAAANRQAGADYKVTVKEAFTLDNFGDGAYFNGTAFRAYQIRIFWEMLTEEPILFTGYGLNASIGKIEEKGREHNIFEGDEDNYGYNRLNFHNQYVEVFADLGIFGFLLVLLMVLLNLKNSIQSKDFVHIAFAVLMITLFLTESFLWRQRGIVFFTTFYCLFNTVRIPRAIEK